MWAWGCWLDHSALTDEIHRHDPEIRHCYERELPRMDPREGKLVVRFTLDLDGELLDVRVKDDTLGSPRLAACVIEAFPQVARTVDHDVIRRWALALDGSAARAPDGALRVAFPGDTEAVPIGWEAWFRLFDEGRLVFVYERGGRRHRVEVWPRAPPTFIDKVNAQSPLRYGDNAQVERSRVLSSAGTSSGEKPQSYLSTGARRRR